MALNYSTKYQLGPSISLQPVIVSVTKTTELSKASYGSEILSLRKKIKNIPNMRKTNNQAVTARHRSLCWIKFINCKEMAKDGIWGIRKGSRTQRRGRRINICSRLLYMMFDGCNESRMPHKHCKNDT